MNETKSITIGSYFNEYDSCHYEVSVDDETVNPDPMNLKYI
jgi:hypothetical protein